MSGRPTGIGPYTIDAELGRGGMGVVYRATDTNLGRTVAIKALPEHLADDPERMARFEREARTLASLNHPNIAQIYGVEGHEGRRYLVLEFVEGQTLAQRIAHGPMPLDDAVDIAAQIAEGVEAAHESGVIHRDLKPGNIIITPEGKAKVLDFGLARSDDAAPASASSMSPTLTSPAQGSPTIPGVILGTAAYMSPEQARGRRVDKRTDIWSFGVILYEMLTGASPFVGETVSDSIGAILHKQIDLDRLPPITPRSVRQVLQRSLQRDKSMRYRDIGDARLDLQMHDPVGGAPVAPARPRAPSALLLALLLLVVGAGAWFVGGITRPGADADPPGPMHLAIPKRMSGNPGGTTRAPFAVAHATRRVLFIGDDGAGGARHLYVRAIDEIEARPIPGTDHALAVCISPDGRTVLFTWDDPDSAREELRRVSIDGGPVTTLLSSDSGPGFDLDLPRVWLSGTSVVLPGDNRLVLYELSLESLETTPLVNIAELIDGAAFVLPWSALPDGRTLLVSAGVVNPARGPIMDMYAIDLVEQKAKRVLADAVAGVVFDDARRIAFGRDETLCVARFDSATKSVVGEFVPLHAWVADFEISPDGDLYYTLTADRVEGVRPVAIGLDGKREPLIDRRIFLEHFVKISPSGDAIGLTTTPEPNGPPTAEILDIETGFMRPVVGGSSVTGAPTWIDEGVVAFHNYRSDSHNEIHRLRLGVDAAGEAIVPLEPEGGAQLTPAFSPDGRWMAHQFSPGFDSPVRGIHLAPMQGDGAARPIVRSGAIDSMPAFSPDGEWLAYCSNSAGENRVVMQGFDTETGALTPRIIAVSQGQGVNPVWSPDGRFLYFADPAEGSLKRVALEREPSLRLSAPEVALTAAQLDGLFVAGPMAFDIFPDGERFAFIEAAPDAPDNEPYINVTLHWLDELRRLMPVE